MNVASLELCKTLYDLSGWKSDNRVLGFLSGNKNGCYYAYDLGYLLRKLPANIHIQQRSEQVRWWVIWHSVPEVPEVYEVNEGKSITEMKPSHLQASADTPEDAAVKLAIDLFRQGVLKREGETS